VDASNLLSSVQQLVQTTVRDNKICNPNLHMHMFSESETLVLNVLNSLLPVLTHETARLYTHGKVPTSCLDTWTKHGLTGGKWCTGPC